MSTEESEEFGCVQAMSTLTVIVLITWILNQMKWNHEWMRVFPLHPDALGFLKRHFERGLR